MSERYAIRKRQRFSRPLPDRALGDSSAQQLHRIERGLDDLFRQVVRGLDPPEAIQAMARLDTLVSSYPDLRVAEIASFPGHVRRVVASIDLDRGSVTALRRALDELCRACVTPQVVQGLRARLYTVSALAAESRPELVPTIALVALSLDAGLPPSGSFVEMVVCASAVEWALEADGDEDAGPLDVSGWLAVQPTTPLRAAVGEELAYYYSAIPGVFALLDPRAVLFAPEDLVGYASAPLSGALSTEVGWLQWLVDGGYLARLRREIRRVARVLERGVGERAGDALMLVRRALESLDELPVPVNPLLQTLLVQSWVRYLEMC